MTEADFLYFNFILISKTFSASFLGHFTDRNGGKC